MDINNIWQNILLQLKDEGYDNLKAHMKREVAALCKVLGDKAFYKTDHDSNKWEREPSLWGHLSKLCDRFKVEKGINFKRKLRASSLNVIAQDLLCSSLIDDLKANRCDELSKYLKKVVSKNWKTFHSTHPTQPLSWCARGIWCSTSRTLFERLRRNFAMGRNRFMKKSSCSGIMDQLTHPRQRGIASPYRLQTKSCSTACSKERDIGVLDITEIFLPKGEENEFTRTFRQIASQSWTYSYEGVEPDQSNIANMYDMPIRKLDVFASTLIPSRRIPEYQNQTQTNMHHREFPPTDEAVMRPRLVCGEIPFRDEFVQRRNGFNAEDDENSYSADFGDIVVDSDGLLSLMKLQRSEKNGKKENPQNISLPTEQSNFKNGNQICSTTSTDAAKELQFRSAVSLQRGNFQKTRPQNIKVPDTMVLSNLSLDVSRLCLNEKRCAVLLPPPLSMLPSVAALAFTYLEEKNQDHRILVYCDGCLQIEKQIFTYLQTIVGRDHLICRKKGTDNLTLANCSSRIVVTSDTSLVGNTEPLYSVVFIMKQVDIAEKFESNMTYNKLIHPSALSIFLCPFPGVTDLEEVGSAIRKYENIFGIQKVLIYDPSREAKVSHQLGISRPSHVYVVPPSRIEAVVEILEESALPLLRSYWIRHAKSHNNNLLPPDLAHIEVQEIQHDMHKLKQEIGHSYKEEQKVSMNELILLTILKRTLVFIMDDCIEVAFQFIKKARDCYHHDILQKCSRAMETLNNRSEGDSQGYNISVDREVTWRPEYISKLIRAEHESMTGETTMAAARTRIQKRFTPLVIVDSNKLMENILPMLTALREVKMFSMEVRPDDDKPCTTYISSIHQLRSVVLPIQAATDLFTKFSHILYFSSSYSGETSYDIPVALQQLSHAGALRFVIVTYDCSRKLEDAANGNFESFMSLCTMTSDICQASHLEKSHDGLESIAGPISLKPELFFQALRTCELQQGVSVHPVSSDCPTSTEPATINFSVGIIARHSVESLASLLFKKLKELSLVNKSRSQLPNSSNALCRIILEISSGMKCLPARTLFEAIMSHVYLTENVSVAVIFKNQETESSGENYKYRPRKKAKKTM